MRFKVSVNSVFKKQTSLNITITQRSKLRNSFDLTGFSITCWCSASASISQSPVIDLFVTLLTLHYYSRTTCVWFYYVLGGMYATVNNFKLTCFAMEEHWMDVCDVFLRFNKHFRFLGHWLFYMLDNKKLVEYFYVGQTRYNPFTTVQWVNLKVRVPFEHDLEYISILYNYLDDLTCKIL